MKHVKMFGKSVPLIAIVLACMLTLGASAVLVNYLSNTVTADVTVVSPMKVGVSLGRESWATTLCYRYDKGEYVLSFPEGIAASGPISDWDEGDWKDSITIVDVHGGDTITLYTMSANLANGDIIGHEEIRVYNPAGITVDDFELITSRFDSIYGDLGYGSLHTDVGGATTDCHNVDGDLYLIEIWSVDDTSTWGAGETDVAMWNITFNDAASGTYTFSYRIVPKP